jgi:TetR/AcrR family transcriptional regulator, mexJK operon transcriptional repressor
MRSKTEEAILDAALKVFSEKGFHRATNRDVATEAGIASPGLIYHYFMDKHDLLRAVLFRQAGESVIRPENLWPTLELKEGLTELATSFLKMIGNPNYQRVARIGLMEAMTDPVFGRNMFAMGPGRVFEGLQDFLQRAMDAGEIERGDAAMLTHLFLGPLIKSMLQRVIFGFDDGVPIDVLAAAHVELFLKGCAGRG